MQGMISPMNWIKRGQTSSGAGSYAYKILQDPNQQQDIPHFDRVNAFRGYLGVGFMCGCSQLPQSYIPGIKDYFVPHFLKDSVSQEEWMALVFNFNKGMADVRGARCTRAALAHTCLHVFRISYAACRRYYYDVVCLYIARDISPPPPSLSSCNSKGLGGKHFPL
jgi:hypothetical protein